LNSRRGDSTWLLDRKAWRGGRDDDLCGDEYHEIINNCVLLLRSGNGRIIGFGTRVGKLCLHCFDIPVLIVLVLVDR
jgi:hypothetical protein